MRFNEVTKECFHFIMAIVYLHTICAILIVLQESESFYQGNLCLETIIKFMHGQNKCNFTREYALEQWKENNVTCQTRCLVTVAVIDFNKNKLEGVGLRFEYESYEYSPCTCLSNSFAHGVNIDIYCPAWNTVKVPLGGYCTQDEQCQRSEHLGVCRQGRCVCRTGYILLNLECHAENRALNQLCSFNEHCARFPYASCLGGHCSCIEGYVAINSNGCVQIKVPLGGYCTQDEQCQRSEHLGVCRQGRCVCRTGYILLNLECHAENRALNQLCSFNEQCAIFPYASCLEGHCSSIERYVAINSTSCVQNNVPVGGYCKLNEQCQENEHFVECKFGRCVCKTGYVLYNLECHKGNLALSQPCFFGEQCAGSPYTSCLREKCSCIEGYTAMNSTDCTQIKVLVGRYCKQNEQCQGSINSGLCKHERCLCRSGHVSINLECHEGSLALNQSCSFSEQCAGSPYASCLGGKCSCIEGYITENSTKCVQSQEFTHPSTLQNNQEEAKIGTTFGALFGGLLLGVVLTTVVVVIIYRWSKTHVNKREEPNVTFADNNRYSLAKIVDHGTFQNIQTKDKKREVSPYACSEETWIYDNVNSKPRQTEDDVYNHLHEQGKQDNVDYYDHACAASAHIGDMGDYGHLRHTTS